MKKFITQNNHFSFLKKFYCASKIKACTVFLCAFFILTNNAFSSKNQVYKKDLQKIENYLNNIKNLSANFVQKSESGYVKGKFYLARPGKMRVEYENQPKILIVVNGSILSYQDLELDEVSNLRTNTTPASFLTRENISFTAKDVKLVDFKKNDEYVMVAVIKKNRPEAGKFKLYFKNEPFSFVKMEVEDELEQATSISLENVEFPDNLNKNLFIIKNKNLPL